MKLSNGLLSSFVFLLTAVWIFVFSIFQNHFNGGKESQLAIHQLQMELDKQKLSSAILDYKLKEQLAATDTNLQEKTGLDKSVNHKFKRQIASVSTDAKDFKKQQSEKENKSFEECKALFLNDKYDSSIKKLKEFTEEFPLSHHREEALFLLSESYYFEKDYSNSIYYIDQLLSQFPESELSGYALLRMGQISEMNNQNDEALEFYKIVESKFSSPKLNEKAKSLSLNLEKNFISTGKLINQHPEKAQE